MGEAMSRAICGGAMPAAEFMNESPTGMARRDCLKLVGGGLLAGASSGRAAAMPARTDLLAKVRAAAELEREAFGLPALMVALIDVEGRSAVVPTGYVDLKHERKLHEAQLLQIGSITKSMTSLVLFRLQEQGLLQLDEPLGKHLPELPLPTMPGLTLRTLLDHTSGLPNSAPFFPRAHPGLWLGSEPGSHFAYSNMGFALLGAVLERRTGTDFASLMRRMIFDPLGMSQTTAAIRSSDRRRYATSYAPLLSDRPFVSGAELVEAPWVEFTGGAGSVAAPAADMLKYMAFLLRAARGDPSPLLSQRSFAEMTTPTVDAPAFGPNAKYACGIAVTRDENKHWLHHTGGMIGFASAMLIDANAGTAAFACTNLSANGYRPRAVAAYAAQALAAARTAGELPSFSPAAPQVIENAADYVGEYVAADGQRLTVQSSHGRLFVERDGTRVAAERTARPDLFAAAGPFAGFALGFRREGRAVRSAFHGATLYQKSGEPELAKVPAEWRAYEGRYLNNDPWRGAVRVIARPDGLWLDGVTPLIHVQGHDFREGEAVWSAERAVFDSMFDGRFLRLNRSGVDYLRVPDDLLDRPSPASRQGGKAQ